MKKIRWMLPVILAFLAGVIFLWPAAETWLLFFPTKYPDGDWRPSGLEFEDVEIAVPDGSLVHGWYCPSPEPIATVLYLHGNAGNLSHRARILRRLQAELGVTVLIIDYRGFGRSDGSPSIASAIVDAESARKFLALKASIPESSIVLMGRSLGGALAIELAASTPARGLIVESSFSSLRDIAGHHYPLLAWLVPGDRLDSAGKISDVGAPLLQSHGGADRTIPVALGRRLFAAAREPKQFVEIAGADHNDWMPDDYYERMRQFLMDLP